MRENSILNNKTYSLSLMIPGLAVYTIIYVIPTLTSFYFALTRWNLITSEFIGFANFISFFRQRNTASSIPNTFIYAFGTSISKVILALLLAVIFSNKSFKGGGYFKSIIYFPTLLSAVAVGITFSAIMHPSNGILNRVLEAFGLTRVKWLTDGSIALYSVMLVDIWKGLGVSMVIYISGLGAIPVEYYEAASIDGSSGARSFFHITLPLLLPSITSVLTLSLIGGLKNYELLWTMTEGGPGYSTEILGTVVYKLFARGNYGIATAGSVIIFVMICAIIYPLNGYLTSRVAKI